LILSNPIVNCLWQVKVASPPTQQPWYFLLPPTLYGYTGQVNANAYLSSAGGTNQAFPYGSYAWSAATTDLRYIGTTNGQPNGWQIYATNNTYFWGPAGAAGAFNGNPAQFNTVSTVVNISTAAPLTNFNGVNNGTNNGNFTVTGGITGTSFSQSGGGVLSWDGAGNLGAKSIALQSFPSAGAFAVADALGHLVPTNTFTGTFTGNGGGLTNVPYKFLSNSVQTVNVKDWGAWGYGYHDDTTAIQNALTFCCTNPTGGRLYFPAGYYTISSPLVVSNGFPAADGGVQTDYFPGGEIYGDNQGQSLIFQENVGVDGIDLTNTFQLYLHDLSFAAPTTLGTNAAATNCVGVRVWVTAGSVNNCVFDRVGFYRFGAGYRGIAEDTKFDTCQFVDNWVGLWADPTQYSGTGASLINNVDILNCTVTQGNQSPVIQAATNIVQVGFLIDGPDSGSHIIDTPSINLPATNGIGIRVRGAAVAIRQAHFEMTGASVGVDTTFNLGGAPNSVTLFSCNGQNPGGGTTNTYPIICGPDTAMTIVHNDTWQAWPVQATTGAVVKMFTNSTCVLNIISASLDPYAQTFKADVFNAAGTYLYTTNAPTIVQNLQASTGSISNLTSAGSSALNTATANSLTVSNAINGNGLGITNIVSSGLSSTNIAGQASTNYTLTFGTIYQKLLGTAEAINFNNVVAAGPLLQPLSVIVHPTGTNVAVSWPTNIFTFTNGTSISIVGTNYTVTVSNRAVISFLAETNIPAATTTAWSNIVCTGISQ
jgi:hypothetical protein